MVATALAMIDPAAARPVLSPDGTLTEQDVLQEEASRAGLTLSRAMLLRECIFAVLGERARVAVQKALVATLEQAERTVPPAERERMTAVIRRFLALDPNEQALYQVGRRTGVFQRLDQLADPALSPPPPLTAANCISGPPSAWPRRPPAGYRALG